MPVWTSHWPVPSRSTVTLTEVSPVVRDTVAVRCDGSGIGGAVGCGAGAAGAGTVAGRGADMQAMGAGPDRGPLLGRL